jgi:hypothetical protein
MATESHYEYVNDLLQKIGFNHLADYTSSIKWTSISEVILDRVNETIPTFRTLFKQRDYNLSRYNYKLQTRDHLLTFIKKIMNSLGISYEFYRYKGESYLRLKAQNNMLQTFIMKKQNMSTGCQLITQGNECTGSKEKLMSQIMTEYGNTQCHTENAYFYGEIRCHSIACLAVITQITCDTPFTMTIGGHVIVKNCKDINEIALPISLLIYNEIKISVDDPNKLCNISVVSKGLNKLRFDPDNYRVMLDCPFFKDIYGEVFMGVYGQTKIMPKPVQLPLCNVKTCNYVIMGKNYNIGYGCTICSSLNFLKDDAIFKLLEHTQCGIDGYSVWTDTKLTMTYFTTNVDKCGFECTAYYVIPRGSDVILGIDSNYDPMGHQLETYGRIAPKIIDIKDMKSYPMVTNCYYELYYVVKNIPFDKIDQYRQININILCCSLQSNHRQVVANADMLDYFK